MKHTRKDISPTRVKLTIQADKSDVSNIKVKTIARLSRQISVPGFRSGKVPPEVAERYLNPVVLASELADDVVEAYLGPAASSEGLTLVGLAEVSIQKFDPEDGLEFTAEIDILPVIKLGDYRNLKTKRAKAEVSSQQVDEVIARMLRFRSERRPADRPAGLGDELTIDFKGSDAKGDLMAGASGHDAKLILGSGDFIPGFEDGLVGASSGQNIQLKLRFPDDYDDGLSGSDVIFDVAVKSVDQLITPELNDDFASDNSQFGSMPEMRADIKERLEAQENYRLEEEYKTALLEELDSISNVPVPESLVNQHMDRRQQELEDQLRDNEEESIEEYLSSHNQTLESWREELKPHAEKNVRIGLLLGQLRKESGIELDDNEIEASWSYVSRFFGRTLPDLKKRLNDPETKKSLALRLLTQKITDWLSEVNQPEP